MGKVSIVFSNMALLPKCCQQRFLKILKKSVGVNPTMNHHHIFFFTIYSSFHGMAVLLSIYLLFPPIIPLLR